MNSEQLKRANILGALMRLDVKRLAFKQEERETFVAIGHMLRKNREATGLSLREVARRMKKSAPYVSDVEIGRRNPTIAFCDDYLSAIDHRCCTRCGEAFHNPNPATRLCGLCADDSGEY